MSQLHDCRDAFVRALLSLAETDQRIVALTNDSISSSKLAGFVQRFPNRFFNVGIAEQNMVGVASGLANNGKLPFVCAASCFLTARALEQIKVDVCYANSNVKLCGTSSGLAYGGLGATHHSIEDVAWMRAIANMTIIVPADPLETEQAVRATAEFVGPVFLRVSRMPVPDVYEEGRQFKLGKATCLHPGTDVTIIANGVMTSRALDAAHLLAARGVAARVLNMATVQPIDREAIVTAATETGAIVTVEEHTVHGGLGSAVAEVVVATCPVPMRILGIPGVFAPTGSAEFLLEHFGLTAAGIRAAALECIEQRATTA